MGNRGMSEKGDVEDVPFRICMYMGYAHEYRVDDNKAMSLGIVYSSKYVERMKERVRAGTSG